MANRLPSVTIEGCQGLIDLLQQLPEKQLLPAVNKGMRAVGTKTMRAARGYLRKNHGLDTGSLKKSLGVRKVMTSRKEKRVVMYLGPRRGHGITKGKRKHDPFNIAHLVEFGHRIAVGSSWRSEKGVKLTRTSKRGAKFGTAKEGGFVQGRPFLRPAVDANRNEFTKQMTEKLVDVLSKAKAKQTKT